MRRALLWAMLLLGLALVAWGAWILGPGTPRHHITALAAEPVRIIDPKPFAQPPPAGSGITGSATAPADSGPAPAGERIKIPDLGIDLPIVLGDGWNAPLYKAAFYPSLGYPGQKNRTVIYAHARPGMFAPLFDAKVGQSIDIVKADGSIRRYTITEYYQHWPASNTSWLVSTDFEQLVLVTCTTYDPNDPRIVVVARPT